MKLQSILTATALTACLMGQSALGYTLAPPKTTSTLTGTLTLLPQQSGQPLTCDVRFVLRTHERKPPEISGAYVKGKGLCSQVGFFSSPPWQVDANSATGGGIKGGGWTVGFEGCGIPSTGFSVNSSGVWTLTPGCYSGTMTANPPVTIVP